MFKQAPIFYVLLCSIFLIAGLPVGGSLHAKDYEITGISILAEIRANGEVAITEERTFLFEGSYSWFEQDIRRQGFLEIRDFEVSEGSSLFRKDDSGEPGTFSVRESRRDVTIRTNFSATDESRTFTLRYVLKGAIASDGEWAEFIWTYLGSDWERAHQNIRIEIRLPEALPEDELVAWQLSRAINPSLEVLADRVLFTADRNRGDRTLRIRAFFPDQLVSGTVPSEIALNPFEIMQEREAEAARKAQRIAFLIPLGWLLSVVALGVAMLLVLRYRKRPQLAEHFPDLLEAPPSDLPPALAGWMFRNLYSDHNSRFVSTIFDLSRKGYFRISQETEMTGMFKKKETPVYVLSRTNKSDTSALRDWERQLVELLEERLNGKTKRLDELFKFGAKESQQQSAFLKWWNKWFEAIGAEARSHAWTVDNTKPMVINLMVQVMLLLFSFFLIIYTSEVSAVSGVALLISSLLGALLTLALNVRTEEGERVYRRWKAYREALKAGRVDLRPELKGVHIVYGIVFGLGKKKMDGLISRIDPQPDDLSWMIFMPGHFPNASVFSGVIHSTVMATTSSISSSTGAGAVGGAAGGGGGGRAG
ncbi:putative membrane protein [Cyclonatronum proteinivorum]|uniref:Putative membrane protein n=2 Tax=Cyclonatronum proteinivorum TaxID=1457365 RepID=A0A345UPX9_9BACT|nr:putative membrane protein [Cyclonatronum proteinivorum]